MFIASEQDCTNGQGYFVCAFYQLVFFTNVNILLIKLIPDVPVSNNGNM